MEQSLLEITGRKRGGGGWKNKAEMKEEKKTTCNCCVFLQMSGSVPVFFHLCLVPVLFAVTSLTEMKFYKNFFPSIYQEVQSTS